MKLSVLKLSQLKREHKALGIMIGVYCRKVHHQAFGLCDTCEPLLKYAVKQLEKCPYQAMKPVCSKCVIHCYREDMRVKIRQVMRFVGPRLIWSHPILAIQHFLDRCRKIKV